MSEWKETDIGILPSNWDVELIGNLIKDKGIAVGVMYPGNYTFEGVPLIRAGDVRNNKIDDNINYRISNDVNLTYKRTILEGGELLVVLVGSPGISAVVPKNKKGWNVARAIGVLKLKDESDGQYLSYALRHPNVQHNLLASCNTSVQPTLNLKELKEIAIPWPTQSTRNFIAEVLSSLDDKIDLLHRQNKTLEGLAEVVFREWFVVRADDGWETVKIGDVAKINLKTVSKNYPFDEIEYLDTGSITEGKISGFQTFKLADAPSRAQRIVEDDDIVYSLVRPIHRHYGIIHDAKSNTVASTGFCVITCDKVSPYFVYVLLTLKETVEFFDMIAEGSTSAYPSLKPSDIGDFEFQIPPNDKLSEFANIANDAWNKINTNTQQIRTLTQTRDGLLPRLMSGEVRVG